MTDDASDADAISLSQNAVDSIPGSTTDLSQVSVLDGDGQLVRDSMMAAGRRRPPPPPSARSRAESDPFIDPGERGLGGGAANSSSDISSTSAPPRIPPRRTVESSPLDSSESVPNGTAAAVSGSDPADSGAAEPFDLNEPLPPLPPVSTRTFTLPSYLTDPELDELCRIFPDFIVKSRLPVLVGKALEEGRGGMGTGTVRISNGLRDEGWRGSRWQRFKMWWRGLWR
jgi:hypothetical protein